jgi:glycosyltransferase involved in cell wall biosynthesis
MRIGMLSWESLYSIKLGGLAHIVSELAEALARRGNEVHVFTRRGNLDVRNQINGVYYHQIIFDYRGNIVSQMDKWCEALLDSFKSISNIFGKFDIIHGHDWHPVLALNRIKMDYDLPYILTIHSTEWGRNGNNFNGSRLSKTIFRRELLACCESSQIIVATKEMLDELQMVHSIPDSKIKIIQNGIVKGRVQKFLPKEMGTYAFCLNSHNPLILYCGRMTYQKGPDLLVDAIPFILEKHTNATFIFAGDGDMSSECKRRARELGVEKKCKFMGFVSHPENLINNCDLICIPSRNEPFGIIVLEAWDACKSIVATDAVHIIKNFDDGLLASTHPESIALHVNYLLENPDKMEKLSLAGKKRVDEKFCWDHIAKATEDVYKEILKW